MASNEKAPHAKRANITKINNFPVSFKGKQHTWNIRKTAKGEFLFQANLTTKTLINTDDSIVATTYFNTILKRCPELHHAGNFLVDNIEVFSLFFLCGSYVAVFFWGAHVAYCIS
jgi:hypothetical protein